MRCVSCQFENMPGTPACVRCGASLRLASSAISIDPPRATKWRKHLRKWLPLRAAYYPARNVLLASGHAVSASIDRNLNIVLPPPSGLLRMVIPGWAHIYLGHRKRGRVLLASWIGCLIVALLSFGSTIGAVALGAVLAVHAASILDIILQNNEVQPRRLIMTMFLTSGALLLVYLPLGSAALQLVNSRQLIQTSEPLSSGDVVLFRPDYYQRASPRPGDVVLYRNTAFTMPAPDHWLLGRATQRIAGEWVDRVIAGPNSTVSWNGHTLLVNGEPSPFLPLNPTRMPAHFDIMVPGDACCIFPTTNPYLIAGGVAVDPLSVCIVLQSQLVGKVLVRNYPIWRWSWMR